MAKITYDYKITMNENAEIPAKNKCRASDMNQIKDIVNENDDNAGALDNLNTTDRTSLVNAINEIFNALEQIPITIDNLPTGTNYNAFYIPKLKICYVNIYANSDGISAGSTVDFGMVPDKYKPSIASALSFYRGLAGGYQASINASGIIRIFTENAINSGSKFIVSGVWYIG